MHVGKGITEMRQHSQLHPHMDPYFNNSLALVLYLT
jgi:hypothetical protein